MKLPGDRGGANGTSIFLRDISINDVRSHFGELTEWASAKIAEGRGAKKGPRLRILFKNFESNLCLGKLARFYVPSSVSNFHEPDWPISDSWRDFAFDPVVFPPISAFVRESVPDISVIDF